jgi:ubiquitin carboxyl-terminal hydrolase 9/13
LQGTSKADTTASTKNKKDEPQPELTPVEKLLHNAGPIREDGSDKFFGLENVGIISPVPPRCTQR